MARAENPLEDCMTVGDLIEQLKNCDPDMPIVFEFPAHDHWRNNLAAPVEAVEEEALTWSDYHRALVVPKPEHPPEKGERTFNAVVIR